MNKYIILILFLAVNSYAGQISSRNTGLIGLWHFNENTNTLTRNEIDFSSATISGASWVTGKFGSCLNFDGTDDYIRTNSFPTLNPLNQITISCWFKWTKKFNKYSNLIRKTYGTSDWIYGLYILNIDNKLGSFLKIGTVKLHTSSVIPTLNVWHNAVVVYDGVTVKMYYDNIQIYSGAQTGNISDVIAPIYIGASYVAFETFDGLIDECIIWNRALSRGEVTYWFNQGAGKYSCIEQ